MNAELTDIVAIAPDVMIDLRYGTTNNVTGKKLYKNPRAVLRYDALKALERVVASLKQQGFSLVIWDAYRPVSAQAELRKVCGDSRYVAEISNHSKGCTVDVTLADASGAYLDMGTEFDDFSSKAHADTKAISNIQRHNRLILTKAMGHEGFHQHPHEWWHFDFALGKQARVLDIEL